MKTRKEPKVIIHQGFLLQPQTPFPQVHTGPASSPGGGALEVVSAPPVWSLGDQGALETA